MPGEESTKETTQRDKKKSSVPPEVSKIMALMGSKGGKIGGKRRAEHMTPDERRESASKAARARWGKE